MSTFVGPIKEIVLGIYDGPHATPPEAESGPVFLGIMNVTEEGRLDFSQIRHISEQDFPKWTRRVTPQMNDIVFSYEATLHRYALIPEGFRGCLGRRMALVRPNTEKVVPRYLYYYFLSNRWRSVVESNVISGATVDRIPLIRFPEFEVRLPSIPVQHKIASILSAYDDLIENNRRRIQLLEEAARLLYREWFVNLRFPGHEHVAIKDGVPEGWEKKTLVEIAATNVESYKASALPDIINYIDISSVKQGRIINKNTMPSSEAPGRARRKARPGDIIWSNVRPNLRAFALIPDPEENDVFSTGFTVISPITVPFTYLYLFVTTDEFVGHLVNHTTGASYPAVRPEDFERAIVLVPPKQMLELFNEKAEPIYKFISVLEEEMKLLAQARDLLLPRLMNGEIAV